MRRSADDFTDGGRGRGRVHSDCQPKVEGRKWKQDRDPSHFRCMKRSEWRPISAQDNDRHPTERCGETPGLLMLLLRAKSSSAHDV